MMSSKEFYDSLKLFNFGEKTGIDLPGEPGSIFLKEEKMAFYIRIEEVRFRQYKIVNKGP